MSLLMCIDVPVDWEYPHSVVQIMWPYPPLFTIFWCSTLGEKHNIIYIYIIVDVYFIMAIMIHDES
jgi:hypothetical protein